MAILTIDKPSDYFNTSSLYRNMAQILIQLTGVGFQPDWLWLKSRSNAYPHFSLLML